MNFQPEQVEAFAELFGALTYDPEAKRTPNIQAGGFIWSDEKPQSLMSKEYPVPASRFMIALLSYREGLMRGHLYEPFTPYWDAFQKCCPGWPGFRLERCSPDLIPELDRELESELHSLERLIKVCERKRGRRAKLMRPDSLEARQDK